MKTQTEFFRDARQHITDLQCDLDSIDAAIEEALERIEDANYNVTQGYRAFKGLKDLRNERKETFAELQAVQMIAERFDCESMLEAYEEIEAEMQSNTDPGFQENETQSGFEAGSEDSTAEEKDTIVAAS